MALPKFKGVGKWYNIKAQEGGATDVNIFDEIGFFGIDAATFVQDIKMLDGADLNVHINSPGGEVFDGLAIYNFLNNYPGKVNTFVTGIAASMASVIALAGDTVNIAENAFMFVHNPAGGVIGDKDMLRKVAGDLETIETSLENIYVKKTGRKQSTVSKWMDDELLMNAQEAKSKGFVDKVTDSVAVTASFDESKLDDLGIRDAIKNNNMENEDKIVNRVIDGLKNLFTNKASDPKNVEIKVTDEVSDFVKQAVADTLKETDQARDAEKKALNDKINILENEKALLQAKLDGRPPASGQGEDPDLEKGKRPKDPDQDFNDTVAKAWGWDEKVNNIKTK